MAVNVKRGAGKQPVESGDNFNEPPEAVEAVMSPSARIIADANKLYHITTKNGIKLSVRLLSSFDEMRLARAVGIESSNETYMQFCYVAAAIAAINGEPEPMPASALECEAIVQRIGDDGMDAMRLFAANRAADMNDAAAKSRRKGKPTESSVDRVKK